MAANQTPHSIVLVALVEQWQECVWKLPSNAAVALHNDRDIVYDLGNDGPLNKDEVDWLLSRQRIATATNAAGSTCATTSSTWTQTR